MAEKKILGILKRPSPTPDKKDEVKDVKNSSQKFQLPTTEKDTLLAHLKKNLRNNKYAEKICDYLKSENIILLKGVFKIKNGDFYSPLDEEIVVQSRINFFYEQEKKEVEGTKKSINYRAVEAQVRQAFYGIWKFHQRYQTLLWFEKFKEPLSPQERKLKNQINREFLRLADMGLEDWKIIQSTWSGTAHCLVFGERHIERIRHVLITSVERGYQKSTFARLLLSPFLELLEHPEWVPTTIMKPFMKHQFYNQPICYVEDIDRVERDSDREKISESLHGAATDMTVTVEVKYLPKAIRIVNVNHTITTANSKMEEINLRVLSDPTRIWEIHLVKPLKAALDFVGYTESFQKKAQKSGDILLFVTLNLREIIHDYVLSGAVPPCEEPHIKRQLNKIGSKVIKPALCEVIFSHYFADKYSDLAQEELGTNISAQKIYVTTDQLIKFAEEKKIIKPGKLTIQMLGIEIKNSRLFDRVENDGYLKKVRVQKNRIQEWRYLINKVWKTEEWKDLRQKTDFKFADEE